MCRTQTIAHITSPHTLKMTYITSHHTQKPATGPRFRVLDQFWRSCILSHNRPFMPYIPYIIIGGTSESVILDPGSRCVYPTKAVPEGPTFWTPVVMVHEEEEKSQSKQITKGIEEFPPKINIMDIYGYFLTFHKHNFLDLCVSIFVNLFIYLKQTGKK